MIIALTFWDVFIAVSVLVGLAFLHAIYLNGFYSRQGIINARNPLPFIGNMLKVFLNKEHILQTVNRVYKEHPDFKYIGFFAFNKPTILMRDLDLIKQVTVKDFDHFLDHKVFMDEEADPLFGRNLFFLRGQKWRDMRITMSPAFTGSKMKNMLPLVLECANEIINYLKNEIKGNYDKTVMEIEMKDIFSRFTNDVIASTAFAVKINSLEEKKNEFYTMGKKATNFSGIQFFKFFGYSACPSIMKFLGIPLFPNDVSTFFRNLIYDSILSRETLGFIRYDMIHLLMQAKKESLGNNNGSSNFNNSHKYEIPKREWTHDDLTAQAVAFLLAGFDTSSSLLCFTAYELALNFDIQNRLQQEIDELVLETDGNLDYGKLQKMEYMDMVVSESLRMWPPDSQLERVCVKAYDLPPQRNSSTSKFTVNKEDDIIIPIYAIQHDPKNHQDPEKFNPERFSPENKPLMHQASFIPFGIGPRSCIGARFAVMVAKAMIFYLLKEFNIVTTPKTPIPMILASDTFTMQSKNGFWLGLKPRTEQ